jgi:hypothetical protein
VQTSAAPHSHSSRNKKAFAKTGRRISKTAQNRHEGKTIHRFPTACQQWTTDMGETVHSNRYARLATLLLKQRVDRVIAYVCGRIQDLPRALSIDQCHLGMTIFWQRHLDIKFCSVARPESPHALPNENIHTESSKKCRFGCMMAKMSINLSWSTCFRQQVCRRFLVVSEIGVCE